MKKHIVLQLLAFSTTLSIPLLPARPLPPPFPRPPHLDPDGNPLRRRQEQLREENLKERHLLRQQRAEEAKEDAEALHLQQAALLRGRQEAEVREQAARLRFWQDLEDAERFRLQQEALAEERLRQQQEEEAKERRSQRVKYPPFYKKVLQHAQSFRQQQAEEPEENRVQRAQYPLVQYVEMIQQQEEQGGRERANRDNQPIQYTPQSVAHLVRRLPMPLLFAKLLPLIEKYLGPQHTLLTPQATILVKRIRAYPTILQWPWHNNHPERTIEHRSWENINREINHRSGAVFIESRYDAAIHRREYLDVFDTGTNARLCTLNSTKDTCTPVFTDASPDKDLIVGITNCIDGGVTYIDMWDGRTGKHARRFSNYDETKVHVPRFSNYEDVIKDLTVAPDKQSILVTYTNGAATMLQVDNHNIEALVHQKNAEILGNRAKKIPLFPAAAQHEIQRGIARLKTASHPGGRSRAYDRIAKAFITGKCEARIALAADIGFGGLPSHY